MKLTSTSITAGERIPVRNAMGKPDPDIHATFADNLSPQLGWSEVPDQTRSFAVIMFDDSAPTSTKYVNKEGARLGTDIERANFFHWILIDLPANLTELAEGAHSDGVTVGGKPGPKAPAGGRHGVNNYREFFGDDAQLGGVYYGYDGPFPPWNDDVVHTYTITVYALNVDHLPIKGSFDGPAVLAAMQGHVLDSASITATYSIAH
ncbi:MAG: YbhB/YbcL family Raf kinase inhibitor-like protein [Actinomycetes bacterium]